MTTEIPQGQETPAPATTELPNGAAAAPADGVAAPAEPQQTQEPKASEQELSRGERRYSELAKQRNAAREEAAYWRGIAEAARMGVAPQAQPEPQPQPQAVQDPEPDPALYAGKEFDPKYAKDVAAWAGRQEARRLAEEQVKARENETKAQAEQREFEEGRSRFINARSEAEALEESHPQLAGAVAATLDDIARMEPPGTHGRLIDVVTRAENKAWVAAALATKPGLLQQIQGLDPVSRALAIGKIDAQISANLRASAAQPAAVKPQPQAQPAPSGQPASTEPPPVINGRGAVASINPEKASMEEYVRWREQQQAH